MNISVMLEEAVEVNLGGFAVGDLQGSDLMWGDSLSSLGMPGTLAS
jgi:hypothetical protein